MFTVPEYFILATALSGYKPTRERQHEAAQIPGLRRRLHALVKGNGLLPPIDPPTGTPPDAEAVRLRTTEMLFPPLLLAIMNTFRSLPPEWVDIEVALSTVVGVLAEIAKQSTGVDHDKLARICAKHLEGLPLSPEVKRALGAVVQAGVITAPGGDA